MFAELHMAGHRPRCRRHRSDAHRCQRARAGEVEGDTRPNGSGVHRNDEDRIERRRSPKRRRFDDTDGSRGDGGERMTRAIVTAGSRWAVGAATARGLQRRTIRESERRWSGGRQRKRLGRDADRMFACDASTGLGAPNEPQPAGPTADEPRDGTDDHVSGMLEEGRDARIGSGSSGRPPSFQAGPKGYGERETLKRLRRCAV